MSVVLFLENLLKNKQVVLLVLDYLQESGDLIDRTVYNNIMQDILKVCIVSYFFYPPSKTELGLYQLMTITIHSLCIKIKFIILITCIICNTD